MFQVIEHSSLNLSEVAVHFNWNQSRSAVFGQVVNLDLLLCTQICFYEAALLYSETKELLGRVEQNDQCSFGLQQVIANSIEIQVIISHEKNLLSALVAKQ